MTSTTTSGAGSSPAPAPAPASPPPVSARRVWALSLVVGAVGLLVFAFVPAPLEPLRDSASSSWPVWTAIALGFAVTHIMVFHVEMRREAFTMSLREVPLAFGLVFLSPVTLVAARLVGILVVKGSIIRTAPHKLSFNVALVFTEAAAACLLLRLLVGTDLWTSPLGWVAFLAVVGVASAISILVVALVVAWGEQRSGISLVRSSGVHLYAPVSASIAVISVIPALIDPVLGWLSLAPIVAVWLVLRSHGDVAQRYRDLTEVTGFSATLESSPRVDDVLPLALEHARALLRADRAVLAIRRRDGARSDHVAAVDEPEGLRAALEKIDVDEVAIGVGPYLVAAGEPGPAAALAPLEYRQAIACPVAIDEHSLGALVFLDRTGASTTFDDRDLPRVEALVQRLTAALRNGLLHQEMEHRATHDARTGLPNRADFERVLGERLQRTDDVAIVMFDIDQFRQVDETLGHVAAETVVTTVVDRIAGAIPRGGELSRVSDHAFGVVLDGGSREAATAVVDAVRGALTQPATIQGLQLTLSVTSGIVLAPAHGTDAEGLLRRCGVAVGVARANHRPVSVYSVDIDPHGEARLALLADLGRALDQGEIDVHFQPKIDLATARVAGVEALIRWDHPDRGPVPPADFIPTVEQSPLMGRVTDYVIDRSLEMVETCREAGHELDVAVNISATDLLDESLPDRIVAALDRHGVDPRQLTVEITETSAVADSPHTRSTLTRLDRLGVEASIDDFGTGYSSFNYLRDLAVDELKIDRRFVRNLVLDEDDARIVEAIVELAHKLNLRVVAEGVENTPTLDWLRDAGCDIAQGYGICRPVDRLQLLRWLEAREPSNSAG